MVFLWWFLIEEASSFHHLGLRLVFFLLRPMSDDPGDALTHWSDELHRIWAAQLLEETGIDNGLRTCGGLHLTASAAHRDQINSEVRSWQQRGARATLLDSSSIVDIEPCLGAAVSAGLLVGGYLLPDEMQIRPPRHLEALESSCKRRGVVIHRGVTVESIQIRNNARNQFLLLKAIFQLVRFVSLQVRGHRNLQRRSGWIFLPVPFADRLP